MGSIYASHFFRVFHIFCKSSFYGRLDKAMHPPYNKTDLNQKGGIYMYQYKTHGTCSRSISIDVEGNTIKKVAFEGGCTGNTQGVSRLVAGMDIDEAISRLEGIQCRAGTSCPDQLAKALKEIKAARA